jgi:hypothetical protein
MSVKEIYDDLDARIHRLNINCADDLMKKIDELCTAVWLEALEDSW